MNLSKQIVVAYLSPSLSTDCLWFRLLFTDTVYWKTKEKKSINIIHAIQGGISLHHFDLKGFISNIIYPLTPRPIFLLKDTWPKTKINTNNNNKINVLKEFTTWPRDYELCSQGKKILKSSDQFQDKQIPHTTLLKCKSWLGCLSQLSLTHLLRRRLEEGGG